MIPSSPWQRFDDWGELRGGTARVSSVFKWASRNSNIRSLKRNPGLSVTGHDDLIQIRDVPIWFSTRLFFAEFYLDKRNARGAKGVVAHPFLYAKPYVSRNNRIVRSEATAGVMEIRDDRVDPTVESAVKGFHCIKRNHHSQGTVGSPLGFLGRWRFEKICKTDGPNAAGSDIVNRRHRA